MAAAKASFLVSAKIFNQPFVRELASYGYRIQAEEQRAAEHYIYFDTKGGSLFQRQYRLRLDQRSHLWQLIFKRRTVLEQESEGDRLPEEGPLAERLSEVSTGRPLLPYLKVRVCGRQFRLETPSKSRIVFLFERWGFSDPHKSRRYGSLYHLSVFNEEDNPETQSIGASEVSYIKILLRDLFGLSLKCFNPLVSGLQKIGRPLPGAPFPQRFSINTSESVVQAASKILAKQAYKMWANTEGTLLDLDTEFLHDLRVAARRARFALKMLGSLLDPERRDALRRELSWIAEILGAVRDIDVFLARLKVQFERAGVTEKVRKEILGFLEERRSFALTTLRESLDSTRYSQIIEGLNVIEREFAPSASSSAKGYTPAALAKKSIGKAVKRISRWLNKKPGQFSTSELHRIRIDFKRLRYTCEFFSDFFGNDMDRMVKLFVRFQDCLGTFNDAQVAEQRLCNLAESLQYRNTASKETLLVTGALIQIQRDLAEAQRAAFFKIWEKFPKQLSKLKKILDQFSSSN
jgi:CHAD domain-containing protein